MLLLSLLFTLAAQAQTLYVDAGSGLQILANIPEGKSPPAGSTVLWDEKVDGPFPVAIEPDAMKVSVDKEGKKILVVDAKLQADRQLREEETRRKRSISAARLPILQEKLKDDSITFDELKELLRLERNF